MEFNLTDSITRTQFVNQMKFDFGFEYLQNGNRSWNHKFTNDSGEVLVVRGAHWVLYHPEDDVIAEGTSADELVEFLRIRSVVFA